jgi:hypothetical protein
MFLLDSEELKEINFHLDNWTSFNDEVKFTGDRFRERISHIANRLLKNTETNQKAKNLFNYLIQSY